MMRSVALLALLPALATAQPKFLHPERIRYDGQCFTIEGKDIFLYSGAFHYFRCPKELWKSRLQKIKDAGFNAVETYVPWNYHERTMPKDLDDYSKVDLRELDEFLTLAERMGFYTIVRPGPYICAEWATGGFPQWLLTKRPANLMRSTWLRSDDPVYLEWSGHWLKAVAPILRKHQLTARRKGDKGTILVQIENEYDFLSLPKEAKVTHLRYLAKTLLDEGVQVPLFSCWTNEIRGSKDPILRQVFDNPNQYPRWDIDSIARSLDEQHRAQPWAPKMVTEQQGGWFGAVGGQLAEEQDGIDAKQIFALTLRGIAAGQTGINYYMLFGGTNFGDWGAEGQTTSYDYNAPIREWGAGGPKYDAVKAIGDFLRRWGIELARTTADPNPVGASEPGVDTWSRVALNGAHYIFAFNRSRTKPATGILSVGAVPFTLEASGFVVYRYVQDVAKGEWLLNPPKRSGAKPGVGPIRLATATVSYPKPTEWRPASTGKSIAEHGINGSEFVFYRTTSANASAKYLWVKPLGGELIPGTPLEPITGSPGGQTFRMPTQAPHWTLLNPGYPNFGTAIEARRGLAEVRALSALPKGSELTQWNRRTVTEIETSPTIGPVATDRTAPSPLGKLGEIPSNSSAVYTATIDHRPGPGRYRLTIASIDDDGAIYVNGARIALTHDYAQSWDFDITSHLKPGENQIAIFVRNHEGAGGLRGPVNLEVELDPIAPTTLELTTELSKNDAEQSVTLDTTTDLPRISRPGVIPRKSGEGNIVRSRVTFAKPAEAYAWEIVLAANADGFLRLNGHDLGRFWRVGPQRGFYLPASWLQKQNVLELTAVPHGGTGRIDAAELRPLPEY